MNTELYKLSESQKSIWYLEKAYPGTSINIVAGTMRLKGGIDYTALEKSINIFIKKNDSMRIRLVETDGNAFQYVSEFQEKSIDLIDFSKGNGLKELFSWDEAQTRLPFNIVNNDLYYFSIFKVSDEDGGFYIKTHHLISDAWTMGLMANQILKNYTLLKNNLMPDEQPHPSFIEHLLSEIDYENSKRFEKDRSYWIDKFETVPEITLLKSQTAGENDIRAQRKTLVTPMKLSNKIRAFCADNNLSAFNLFISALAIYINRVTGNEDIILGTPILNRINIKEKETTGMFVSVAAPIRISVSETMNFQTFVRAMMKESSAVLRHQKYPYNYLIRELKKKHKLTNRLYDIVLSYQNSKTKVKGEEESLTRWHFSGYQVESLIISVNDRDDDGNFVIDYDFLTDVYNAKEIEFIHQHIISLLWHALDNPVRSISKLEMISEKEKHTILHEFNDTYADYPRYKTIHSMFEEQVERTPNNIALIFGDNTLTYEELNKRSNRLARSLRAKGVGPDKAVGIMAYRSLEMVIGIMAILKAGGAYMPVEPDYPPERKEFMLDNSFAEILLTQHDLINSIDFDGITIDLKEQSNYDEDCSNLPDINSPKDLAYIIYTSGSTGRPKGVMIEHTGVVNSYCWGVKKFNINEDSIILQKTPPTFDPSVWEIFWWLMAGGQVCLISSGEEKDPKAIISAIDKFKVTTMHFVPSMLGIFLDYVESVSSVNKLASLKQVFSCGEAIRLNQVELFNKLLFSTNGTEIFNMYGPTEATVEVASFDCSPSVILKSVPIGKRIDNFKVYILDSNLNILPIGIPGELYISGAGVSRGYLNNPELTSERFVENPFIPGEIMYRTGDRARWYPKGDIEFLGRIDYQVKIKGFRIELGEIESMLLAHESVNDAVVKAEQDDNGIAYLAAFIVAAAEVKADDIRAYLAEKLPSYMVPSVFMFLDRMPLNNSGKTDRNALPKPNYCNILSNEYIAPSNEVEAALARIWSNVLKIEKIGVTDEYSSIGGDSLNAIIIVTEIQKRFGVEISPKLIFNYQTIKKLAEHIANADISELKAIPKAVESEYYPLSYAQKMWYKVHAIEEYGTSNNLSGGMLLEGSIELNKIESIFRHIIQRHESLRTTFEVRGGVPAQLIHNNVDFNIEYYEDDEFDFERAMVAFSKPFDLATPPLIRACIVRTANEKHFLLLELHHIVSDGTSMNIIVHEFVELFNKNQLPELKIQYKDYSQWQHSMLKTGALKSQEKYWLERFSGDIPVLNLPLDYPRPSVPLLRGQHVNFSIDSSITASIRRFTAETGTTMFMLLLTAYNVLLSHFTGQDDVVVGVPIEDRRQSDLRNMIGVFANVIGIRTFLAWDKPFLQLLLEVKENVLDAYEHQEYPFYLLVEKLGLAWDAKNKPLFNTTFALQNLELSKHMLNCMIVSPIFYSSEIAKFDLSLTAFDLGNSIEFDFVFRSDLFSKKTIGFLSKSFVNILKSIIAEPPKILSEICIQSENE